MSDSKPVSMMNAVEPWRQRYIDFWTSLNPESVAQLPHVFTEDVRFRDPHNDVRGHAGLSRIFNHLFASCAMARFSVLEAVSFGRGAYLRWEFRFTLRARKNPGRQWCIEGVSRVVCDDEGRIREHLDFWDPAQQLYEQLPVVGGLFRVLRRRLAAPGSTVD